MPSLPMRGAWIEIRCLVRCLPAVLSLPMRGAWIEIMVEMVESAKKVVAPHAGSVD